MKTAMWLAAAGAAAMLFGLAAPAQAQTGWSFGVTVGSGGYYSSPWRGSYYDRYYYGRRTWSSCRYDPWCDPYFNRPYRSYRTWAPPPVYYAPPPVIVYETRDRYDPLPRWRDMAPRDYGYSGYGYGYPAQEYSYAAPDYSADIYREPLPAAAAPATLNGAVRYDLARQGYSADEVQSYRDSLTRSGYDPRPYSQSNGVAQSYIRGSAADPDRALLGGPR